MPKRSLLLYLLATLFFATAIGLLATPTVCQCGAAWPHPHALFELPNHSHGPREAITPFADHGSPGVVAAAGNSLMTALVFSVLASCCVIGMSVVRTSRPRPVTDPPPRGVTFGVDPPPPR